MAGGCEGVSTLGVSTLRPSARSTRDLPASNGRGGDAETTMTTRRGPAPGVRRHSNQLTGAHRLWSGLDTGENVTKLRGGPGPTGSLPSMGGREEAGN